MVKSLQFIIGILGAAAVLFATRGWMHRYRQLFVRCGALALFLTPTIVAGGHGAVVAPVWYAFAYYLGYDPFPLKAMLQLALLPFLVVWLCLFGFVSAVETVRGRRDTTP